MPKPNDFGSYKGNRLIDDERLYDKKSYENELLKLLATITDEQRGAYEEILDAVLMDKGGVFFLCGFGGTGKTYIWNTLSSALRSQGRIVLNTASSGIAATLLPGGRTTHSRFGIPINPSDSTTSTFTLGSDQAELFKEASLIIWDEAPMISRHCFESLDRNLCDVIRTEEYKPFGGKVVVFRGDFRQIPMIVGGGRSETIMASLNSSYLWQHCKVLRLTKNMRLQAATNERDARELKDGKVNEPNHGIVEIDVPRDILITGPGDPIETIRSEVYGKNFKGSDDIEFYHTKAILSPTNDEVDKMNKYMLDKLPSTTL